MLRTVALPSLLLCAASLQEPASEDPPAPAAVQLVSVEGAPFAVSVHALPADFALQVAGLIEDAWRAAAWSGVGPELPGAVQLFAAQEDLNAAAASAPPAMRLAVRPRFDGPTRAAVGLHPHTRREVALWALRHRLGGLGDGPLARAALRATLAVALGSDDGEDPGWCGVLQAGAGPERPPADALLDPEFAGDPATVAARTLLVRDLLHESPRTLEAAAAESARAEGPPFGEALRAAAGDLAQLEAGFAARLAADPPRWVQVSPELRRGPDGWIQHGLDAEAVCWSREELGAGASGFAGEVFFHAGGEQAASVFLGLAGGGFLALVLEAGFGVTLLEVQDGEPQRRRRVASFRADDLPAGRPVRFGLELEDGLLVLSLNGERRVRTPDRGRRLLGNFGVGAGPGTTVVWRELSGLR